MNKILITLIIVLTIALGLMYTKVTQTIRPGAAQNATPAILATTSQVTIGIGTDKRMLFTENTVCVSRVVSTSGQAALLSFGVATSTTNPGPTTGYYIPASTTIAFDASIWGCTAVSAYGYIASTTITIAEFR